MISDVIAIPVYRVPIKSCRAFLEADKVVTPRAAGASVLAVPSEVVCSSAVGAAIVKAVSGYVSVIPSRTVLKAFI